MKAITIKAINTEKEKVGKKMVNVTVKFAVFVDGVRFGKAEITSSKTVANGVEGIELVRARDEKGIQIVAGYGLKAFESVEIAAKFVVNGK